MHRIHVAIFTALLGAGTRSAAEELRGDAAAGPPAALTSAAPDSVPIPRAHVEVTGTPVAVVRGGPGPQHPIVATLADGDRLEIDARAGAWYHLQLPSGAGGWVHESLLRTWVDPRTFEFAPDPGRPPRMRSFHLAAFAGSYAADREDNGPLAGLRIGYSITDRFAFESSIGWTRVVRSTYVLEQLYGLRLEEERFSLFYYEAGATMELLPRHRVTPFVAAGFGASVLNARVEPSWMVGLGTRIFLNKRTGLRWELRNHHLQGGNQFTRFAGDNLEFSGGAEFLF
jgi:hypothetical protein